MIKPGRARLGVERRGTVTSGTYRPAPNVNSPVESAAHCAAVITPADCWSGSFAVDKADTGCCSPRVPERAPDPRCAVDRRPVPAQEHSDPTVFARYKAHPPLHSTHSASFWRRAQCFLFVAGS